MRYSPELCPPHQQETPPSGLDSPITLGYVSCQPLHLRFTLKDLLSVMAQVLVWSLQGSHNEFSARDFVFAPDIKMARAWWLLTSRLVPNGHPQCLAGRLEEPAGDFIQAACTAQCKNEDASSFSSCSSFSVACIFPLEKGSISRPCTMVCLPSLQVTGKE